ncbi:MAG TPA: winged helix-turn-helix domain-containing protein [Streptosporangiaceae bacterium]|jgi:DNA-binding transcriptional ArsR family regulator
MSSNTHDHSQGRTSDTGLGDASRHQLPDYELEGVRVVSSAQELRAMADPLRGTLLDLVLERAATVNELAAAVGRPKSTVAHHVAVLTDAGMFRVVRTRKVRAIDERFYGRTARIFYVGTVREDYPRIGSNYLSVAAAESGPAHEADDLRAIIRHARIPAERAAEFWQRVFELTHEFSSLPRAGQTVYGFVAGLYPTDYPALAEQDGDSPTRGGGLPAGAGDRAGASDPGGQDHRNQREQDHDRDYGVDFR